MSETSQEAYDPINRSTLRIKVFKAVIERPFGGTTCDELEISLGMIHQSCSARVNELMNSGWIFDSGFRRKTRNGRNAIVWLPAEHGEEMLRMLQKGEIT